MASLLPNETTYATLVTNDSDFRAILWNRVFTQSFRYRSKWRHFTGPQESGMPIVKKTDLEAGVAQDVVFSMVSPVGGQGKLGENLLREATRPLTEHSFRVRVDLERQAVAYNQLINWLRADMNPEQMTVKLLSDWAVQKYDDNIMTVLRRYGKVVNPNNNLIRIGGGTSESQLLSSNTFSPASLELSKGKLMGLGASPIATDMVESGSVVPQFLFYGPDALIRSMRTNSTYLNTVQYGDVRGKDNALFTGRYPMWDNNVIYADEQGSSDIDGRQGTPLLPMAFLGTALTEGTSTALTGGGTTDPAGTSDYFANFPGYPWYITTSDSLPTDAPTTHYAMIFNLTGADAGKYEVVSYTTAGFGTAGDTLTVTRGSSTDGAGNQRALGSQRYQNTHPSGSVIVPCTIQGVPLMWGLHLGSDALRYANGAIENERKDQLDDFELQRGISTNTIRGMAPFTDRRNIAKNFQVVEGTGTHPLLNPAPVAYSG